LTTGRPGNIAASVRQRLLNLSRQRGEDFQLILIWYAAERFLYRLTMSEHSRQFILKGAMLLNVWMDRSHRPTRDLDFAGYGEASPERLITIFREICEVEVEEDGLQYDTESIQVNEIRENQQYQGQRVRLMAYLEAARIPVQIDIGFGDVVSPEAEEISYPTLLDSPVLRILAYPPETVISEKLQAMVALGMLNSRMKDFYDLRMIAKLFTFDGSKLVEAIRATFNRRKTEIPEFAPVALTEEFSADRDKVTQWKAFLTRSGLENTALDLPQIIEELRLFLIPPLQAAANDWDFNLAWARGGPWSAVGG
jgi:predicted nucleotidyltransferase component of viral defense system